MRCHALLCDNPRSLSEEEAVDVAGYPMHPACAPEEEEVLRQEQVDRLAAEQVAAAVGRLTAALRRLADAAVEAAAAHTGGEVAAGSDGLEKVRARQEAVAEAGALLAATRAGATRMRQDVRGG